MKSGIIYKGYHVKQAKIFFQPSGRQGKAPTGVTVIEASRLLGADIESLCGGKKTCGKCKIRVEEGLFQKFGIKSSGTHLTPWEAEEGKYITADEKDAGYRLGCVARVKGDIQVFVPEESRAGKQVVSKKARDIHIDHNPTVKIYHIEMQPPTIDEPVGDFERICREMEKGHGLKDLTVDLFTLRQIPTALRDGDWKVTVSVWNDREVIRIRSGKVEHAYGLAIDIGTTTVAGYVCDLTTMEVIDTVTLMNPQCKYGEDVMARIAFHVTTEDGLTRMSDDIIEGLNWLIDEAVKNTHPPKKKGQGDKTYLRLSKEDIEDITIVGNTAMHHILLKLNPKFLGSAPFPPVIHRSLDIKARDLGININPSSYVFMLPNEAGFVGADNVGVLIAETPYRSDNMQLIIDIGTNGELVFGNKERMLSASCATGPALEGAQIQFGMRASPGAIERFTLDPETYEVDYKVIGREAWRRYSEPNEMKCKGICGSGVLDVLAELYRAGVVTKSGAFSKKQTSNRFRRNPEDNSAEFVIAWKKETSIGRDIVLTQKDIREIQLAKGALYCGCKLLMRRMGVEKLDTVKIAGAFGTHVDKQKALTIGLFPDCDIEKVVSVGNAAGDGARIALLNREKRSEADWVARHVEYIELTVEKNFQEQFIESLEIPHMTDKFPHLEGLVKEIPHRE